MADRYLQWTRSDPGRFLSRRLGLPRPAPLHRWSERRPVLEGGPLLHLTAGRTACDGTELAAALGGCGLEVRTGTGAEAGTPSGIEPRTGAGGGDRFSAVVLDATGIRAVAELREVHRALHPVARRIADGGRVVVLGAAVDPGDHHQAAAQQALEGFVRSLGKEVGGGRTAQLLRLAPGASAAGAASTLRFLLSPKSAYVSGQVVEVAAGLPGTAPGDPGRPLAGRTALVTGAGRGIGEAVAATLARDGAHVLCLDVPQAERDLADVAERLGGTPLPLDITADDAGARIEEALPPGGLDVLVHNAGITRDRRFANMAADRWDAVLEVNLDSVLRTTDHLLQAKALPDGGRIVATASIAGLAGNTGQTNYAASKAGIVGLVRALAPAAAERHGVTVNAVAPGFIETRMTAAVPLVIREAGRRMNSLAQGGLPVDVAETTAWLAHPESGAVNGQIVRVCGQSLLGA